LNKKTIIDRRKPATKKRACAGRIISAVPVLFLVFVGAMKLMNVVPVLLAFPLVNAGSVVGLT